MRAVIAFAAWCVAAAAFAQDAPAPAEDGIGPYHFGMDEAALRATAPNAHWTTQQNAAGDAVLTGGPRIALGASRLTAAFMFNGAGVERIVLLGASNAACEDAVQTVLADLEPDYGAFASAPPPWEEVGATGTLQRTEAGSELRVHENADTHAKTVAATRAGPMFMQVIGQKNPDDPACHLSLTLTPIYALGRAPEDEALWSQIDHAQTLVNPHWLSRPSGSDFARSYPPEALTAGVEGQGVLQCLVAEDGSLNCLPVSERPVNSGFAAAALQVVHAFRVERDEAGASAVGKRYRMSILFRTNGPH